MSCNSNILAHVISNNKTYNLLSLSFFVKYYSKVFRHFLCYILLNNKSYSWYNKEFQIHIRNSRKIK